MLGNSNYKIEAVFTQPPKKKSRGQKLTKSPVHQFADKLKIPVRCPEDLDSEYEVNLIKDMQPDIIIVVAYGKILPERLLVLSKIDFLNIHASLLPKWRGAAPIQRAIMNMDDETGISILIIEHNMDFILRQGVDRIIVMNEGEVLMIGTPEEVKSNKAVIEAYLGSAGDESE